ncbi:hypothetical protein R1flu_017728 [Riccia fluitans]|uniref:Uncharacterized protein n=1 Tax=Riccia fluitans TaxID=41844 RepID=A0ABD1ZE31_9MARC
MVLRPSFAGSSYQIVVASSDPVDVQENVHKLTTSGFLWSLHASGVDQAGVGGEESSTPIIKTSNFRKACICIQAKPDWVFRGFRYCGSCNFRFKDSEMLDSGPGSRSPGRSTISVGEEWHRKRS